MTRFLNALVLIVIGSALAALLWYATRPPPLIIQGEVSADRYDISARVSGRVIKLNADVGDTVKKGDVIVELESPDLVASLDTQRAARDVAKADYQNVITVRPEDVAAKKADVDAAEADLLLQSQTLKRKKMLRKNDTVSQADLDTAIRNYDSAEKKRDAAVASFELTKKGASEAARVLARTKIKQTEAQIDSIESQVNELKVIAPTTALVTTRVAELGENFSPGAPLISLIDMNNLWFTFNIREDYLKGLTIGDEYEVVVPALNNKTIKVRATVINVLGQFATWRATRATGDFDLRTFEVRGTPLESVDGLRPGMSAIATIAPKG